MRFLITIISVVRARVRRGRTLRGLVGCGVAICIGSFMTPHSLPGAWETPQVYRSDAELFGSADLNDSGHPDILLIERESGVFLIGEGGPGGAVAWREARSSGILGADDASFGAFGDGGGFGFAVGGRSANRIHVFPGDAPALAAFPQGVGPGAFTGIPSATLKTSEDGLLASTVENGEGIEGIRSALQRRQEGFAEIQAWQEQAASGFSGYAYFEEGAGDTVFVTRLDFPEGAQAGAVFVFEAWNGSGMEVLTELQALAGERAVFGNFGDGGGGGFVRFVPGATGLTLYAVSAGNGDVDLKPMEFLDTKEPVESVVRLPGDPARLLVVFDGGAGARVFEFDSDDGFLLIDELVPPGGTGVFTGGVPLADGDFMLFSGAEPGGVSELFHRVQPDGEGGYEITDTGALPSREAGFFGANVSLYDGDPLADLESRLLERRGAGAWSVEGFLESDDRTIAYVSVFDGESAGLSDPLQRDFGPAPDDATHVLTNQPAAAAAFSMYDFEPVASPAVDPPRVAPVGGTYDRSVRVSFEVPPGTQAYYRSGEGGSWETYQDPFWLFQDTDVEYYARAPGGAASEIRTARYRFSVEPHEMDSNGNGVPDFIEISYGYNPHAADASDGKTSLDRILDAAAGNGEERADVRSSFDVVVDVRAFFDGGTTARPEPGTRVRIFDAGGTALSSGRFDEASGEFPRVRVPEIPANPAAGLYVGRSPNFYGLDGIDREDAVGREGLSVQSVPVLQAPEVDYEFGQAGGDHADEVDAWTDAALDAFQHTGRRAFNARMAPVDTLHAAILERTFALLLADAGEWETEEAAGATMFPFRSGDSGRFRITAAHLRSLADPGGDTAGGVYFPSEIVDALRDALDSGDGAVTALRDFANAVHHIGSTEGGDAAAGNFPAPIEVFRALLTGEPIPGDYGDEGEWSESELDALRDTAVALVDLPQPRMPVERGFAVDEDSFLGVCLTVFSLEDGSPVSLVRRDGSPYRFPGAFPLPAGTRILVYGFEEPVRSDCSGEAMEVLSVWVLEAPDVIPGDGDGNLLSDDWERFFFGKTGVDPFESPDGSGYSALQQYLEGTDPTDPGDVPAEPVEDLRPPSVRIAMQEDGSVRLDWDWSEKYADRIGFVIEYSDGPGGDYHSHPVPAEQTGNGEFQIELPGSADERRFFRVVMTLDS